MEKHLEPKSLSFEYGGKEITLETGRIARQATAAVLVTVDQTQVLTTVVAKKEADPGKDFFPLAVFYQEKFYAAGKIPGGYFKREARPTEKETLTSRLIDRPIRPLFPDEFKNDVQIMSTVISSDAEFSSDIAAMIGAPIIAAMSEENSASEDITVDIIWTSFLNSSGNKGLIGLSISLEVNVSFSVGLASLLKYPPGIFPAA